MSAAIDRDCKPLHTRMNNIQHFQDGKRFTIVKVYQPTERHPDCSIINSATSERCQYKADGLIRFDESGKEIAICKECLDREFTQDR
jgi:hypothetical protein